MNLSKHLKVLSAVVGWCFLSISNANAAHTWTTVYSNNGTWTGSLSSINEHASFVDVNGNPITQFIVDELTPVKYGFNLARGDDFDVAYTLTLTQKNQQTKFNPQFTSKTCVFVVTAISPGHPDIQIIPYNGAQCTSERLGSIFYVE